MERAFESFLWGSRFLVLTAVLGSLVAAAAMFAVSSLEVVHVVELLLDYPQTEIHSPLPGVEASAEVPVRPLLLAGVVEIIDGYLLAIVLLIFALGLYELFISRIDQASGDDRASSFLVIRDLDDLKSRLGKVVLMILIVTFFQHAVTATVETTLDLVYFGIGVCLIGAALWLSRSRSAD